MSKKNNNNDNNYHPYDGDDWNEMSPIRAPDESDEDYEERMKGIYGEDVFD